MIAYSSRVFAAAITVTSLFAFGTLASVTFAQLACDFDSDGFCDVTDIDALSEQVIHGDPDFDPKFDLSADGQLDLADRDEWLSLAATENGFGSPYFLGDADLNGLVSSSDL